MPKWNYGFSVNYERLLFSVIVKHSSLHWKPHINQIFAFSTNEFLSIKNKCEKFCICTLNLVALLKSCIK